MKHVWFVGIVSVCFILMSFPVHSSVDVQADGDVENGVFDKTLIMGTVINPEVTNDTISASALYLFYFESGLLIKKGGIVKGLTMVSMTKTPLFLLYTPGPFGMISYIYGFAEDFTIHSE